jgi:succinyl-diaminopimelate desuccinylase
MTGVAPAGADGALAESFLVEVLGSLVSTPSVNPGIFEVAMAERVQAWLSDLPAEVTVVEFEPGRPSVAAVLGDPAGPRLVLNGHMDTVPIDDPAEWDSEPFTPTIRDGWMYGRGACDMKAGLATQIAVAHHLAALDTPLRGALVLQFASGEECGEPGTLSMLQAGFTGDYGIVTEPTQCQVSVATRGLGHYRLGLRGRSIHASQAHLGVNPVGALRAVLEELARYDAEARAMPHPLLPGGTLTPTVVNGGVKVNAVADTCELLLDRRLLPGETIQEDLDRIVERLQGVAADIPGLEYELSALNYPFEPAEIPSESEFAARVSRTVRDVTGRPGAIIGTPYASDVRNLVNDAGIEAVTFGPGNVAECHCANERVALAELRDTAAVIADLAREMLV